MPRPRRYSVGFCFEGAANLKRLFSALQEIKNIRQVIVSLRPSEWREQEIEDLKQVKNVINLRDLSYLNYF